MTVLSVTGNQGACQYGGVPVGQTVTGIGWDIAIQASSISLDENVRNAPTDDVLYAGTVNGMQFSASYTQPAYTLTGRCPFRTGTLTGTFSSDLSTFDATETLVFEPADAEGEMTVQNHWTGSRR